MEGSIRPRRQSILIGQRSLDVYGETEKGPKFVLWLIRMFRKWGFFIAEWPWTAIILCLIVSAISTVKIVLTPQRNEITGYTPYGARANDEFLEYQNFFSSQGTSYDVFCRDLSKSSTPTFLVVPLKFSNESVF
ncbi:unnamed protein product [Cylicostephanus goldi]|uniref:SSD domain-containing protein n=1 Tax=Cylicostephanus goldi TaxID=71465 RepID=A0A3P7MAB7_CYLGO|nr:unnamed protein product [Cylicostephanus goldi]